MLSLPGSRWRQNNNDRDDLRLWKNQDFQKQAAKFWQDLARELKDHPAIVGYNILNEPHPERLYNTIVVSKMNDKFSLRDYPLRAASLYVSVLSFILENTITILPFIM